MKCPLCDKDLIISLSLDPETGKEIVGKKCPQIINLVRVYVSTRDRDKSIRHYNVNHYWIGERGEVAYVPPYRIHNVLDENYCEVSSSPTIRIYPPYSETDIIFKSPLIKMTEENKLRQRIKTLVLFS